MNSSIGIFSAVSSKGRPGIHSLGSLSSSRETANRASCKKLTWGTEHNLVYSSYIEQFAQNQMGMSHFFEKTGGSISPKRWFCAFGSFYPSQGSRKQLALCAKPPVGWLNRGSRKPHRHCFFWGSKGKPPKRFFLHPKGRHLNKSFWVFSPLHDVHSQGVAREFSWQVASTAHAVAKIFSVEAGLECLDLEGFQANCVSVFWGGGG